MKCAYRMWKEDGISVFKAAKMCGIPVQTLRGRTLGQCDPYKYKSGRNPYLSSADEAVFVAHVVKVAGCGYGFMRREIAELAAETGFYLNTKEKNVPVNDKWVHAFINRWPDLKVTKPKDMPTARARFATRVTTHNYYKELLDILLKYDLLQKPHRIFNLEETSLSRVHTPQVKVEPSGGASVAEMHNRSATVVNCVSATGQVVPSYIIFKGMELTEDMLVDALPDTCGTVSASGSVDSKILQKYLKEHFLKHVPTYKDWPLLLLYDGHCTHVPVPLIEWAKDHNIIMYMLPAHTTHPLRPTDVGVFKPFKVAYNNECRRFLRANPAQCLRDQDFCRLTANAMTRGVTPRKVVAGFRRIGIFPLNPNVVSDAQLALNPAIYQ